MKNWLEKQFKLSEYHTDVKTELLAEAGGKTGLTVVFTSIFFALSLAAACWPWFWSVTARTGISGMDFSP